MSEENFDKAAVINQLNRILELELAGVIRYTHYSFMVHGFGQDAPGLTNANGKGASDVKLQSRYALDPISGGAGMRVNFVRLVKEA